MTVSTFRTKLKINKGKQAACQKLKHHCSEIESPKIGNLKQLAACNWQLAALHYMKLPALDTSVEAMKSGGLRSTQLSTNKHIRGDNKTPNYVLHLPFFIAFFQLVIFL